MIYLGIDWSGAKQYFGGPIQLAITSDAEDRAEVIAPPDGARHWTRTAVAGAVHALYQEITRTDDRAVVGLDFAFSFPFVDQNNYFPGDTVELTDAFAVWAHIDAICQSSPDTFAGAFYRCPPYNAYFANPKRQGLLYVPRWRVTEQLCAEEYGITPQTIYHLVGPRTVGVGSCAGMRWLQALRQERERGEIDFCVWPFEPVHPSDRLIFVEIYPRLCRLLLDNPPTPAEMPSHQRDALLAAHGLKLICQRPDCWDLSPIPETTYRTEGWIFGV